MLFDLITVNVLKILNTSCLTKRHRQTGHVEISLFRVFSVCYSDMHFVNSSPDNQKFVEYRETCSKFSNIY